MWKSKIKFGFIKGSYSEYSGRKSVDYIFRVKIIRETNDIYEIEYGRNMIHSSDTANSINGLSRVVEKSEIYGIYELELNWLQRQLITYNL